MLLCFLYLFVELMIFYELMGKKRFRKKARKGKEIALLFKVAIIIYDYAQ